MWLAANHAEWRKGVRRQPNRNHAIAALAAAIAYLKAQPLADEPESELLLRPLTDLLGALQQLDRPTAGMAPILERGRR
jgi:hypothetical protein